jgi:hypothetical protein
MGLPENRTKTGQFVKGKSGNPGGRPKVPEPFKELVQSKSVPALERIIEIMENPASKPGDVFMCAKLILEYANGKPTDNMNLTHGFVGDFTLEMCSDDDD